MKRFLLFASAVLAMLLAGSCQQELDPITDGDTTVTFKVSTGEVATKADIADATNIDVLYWEIYNTSNIEHADAPLGEGKIEDKDGNKTFLVDLKLLADQDYTIVFWAQVDGKSHYDVTDLRRVKIEDYSDEYANDESRAAFFATYPFHTDNGVSINEEVTLYRPFSQINLGSTTYETDLNNVNGGQVKIEKTSMTVANIATMFNTLYGVGEGTQKVTFNKAATPNGDADNTEKILSVNGEDYYWLGMNYLIVEGNSDNVEVDVTIVTNMGTVNHSVSNVPVKENYRTNIIGNFLTTGATFNVVIDERFEEPEYYGPEFVQTPAYDAATNTYTITSPNELAWLAAAVNGTIPPTTKADEGPQTFKGKTFVLANDIDLDGMSWTPIGATGNFEGTFDGKGKTISNFVVRTEGNASAGLFARTYGTIQNLTVSGAEIYGHYKAGVIVGDGLCSKIENCHVVDAVVESTPYNNDDANHVGGIVGYLSAEGVASVTNSSVTNSYIKGYRDVGGIAGTANGPAVVTGNIVSETTVEADLTDEYVDNTKDCNAGAIVGRVSSKANVSDNTVGEEVVIIRKVDSTEELAHAVAEAQDGDTIYLGAGTYPMASYKNGLSFKGDEEDPKDVIVDVSGKEINLNGGNVSFENLTLKYANQNYKGFQHTTNETYKNCIIEGQPFLYGENVTFDGCTFEQPSAGAYNIWTYGAKNATFTECEFNSAGKAVLVYNEGVDTNVSFDSCEFSATAGAQTGNGQNIAAIEISNHVKSPKMNVTINNCTSNGGFAYNQTIWRIKDESKTTKENITLIVDGELVTCFDGYYLKGNAYVATTADGLKTLLGKSDLAEVSLSPGEFDLGVYYLSSSAKTIKSVSADNKALITGKFVAKKDVVFENVAFAPNASSTTDLNANTYGSQVNKNKAILTIHAVAATFEGCSFVGTKDGYSAAAITYWTSVSTADILTIKNCEFEGASVYSRARCSVTKSSFKNQESVVYLYKTNDGSVEVKDNSIDAVSYAVGVLTGGTTYMEDVNFDVQGNGTFTKKTYASYSSVVYKNITFAPGSETFEISAEGKML